MSARSTNAVFSNLSKPVSTFELAWETLPVDTEENFVASAKRWLGDRSNLSSKTLDTANWNEIYGYYKDQQ